MRNALRLAFVVVVLAALAACTQVAPKGPSLNTAAVPGSSVRQMTFTGTSSFDLSTDRAAVQGLQSPEFPAAMAEHDTAGGETLSGFAAGRSGRVINRLPAKERVTGNPFPASGHGAPQVSGEVLTSGTSFEGLNHFDQRYADGGNQFSLEPPDQGLCVGQNYILETVNDVVQVYDKSGNGQGVASLNQFFYGDHAIDRTTGTFGEFVTDPSCLYDASSGHWFLVVLTLDVNPANGAFLGTNHIDVATSVTDDPTGDWNTYSMDVTNDGLDANGDPACPPGDQPQNFCLGDYPHFAVNADGLFITTDSFPFFLAGYNGAWLYAVDKSALESGTTPNVVAQQLPDNGGASYSVAPAISTGTPESGTQYLVSATTAYSTTSGTIAVWAVTGTDTLSSASPSVTVSADIIGVDGPNGLAGHTYGDPVDYAVPQRRGNVPLAKVLTGNRFGYGGAGRQVEGPVATNDSGMKQAVFVNNHLYSALTTVAYNHGGASGNTGAGVAWFDVTPNLDGGTFTATLNGAGVVAPSGQNVIFPAITVKPDGSGAIAVTLVGPNDYPSAALIPFDATAGAGDPQIIRSGAGPQDGFTEYWLGGYSPRWGDYGASALDPSTGDIWLSSEMINQTCSFTSFIKDYTCGGTRSALANWSTQITQVPTE